MSAVFDAIESVAEDVFDVAGSALEWGVETATGIVEGALDDPVKAAAQIAAVATGQAWALPVIAGVDVLQEGGSIEDALTSAAVSYAVGQGVGYAMDSFGAAGATGDMGSGTTQFFDDGTSIQMFDDGSSLVTDATGQITPTAPADAVGTPLSELSDATGRIQEPILEQPGLQPSGAETIPLGDQTIQETILGPAPESALDMGPEVPALGPESVLDMGPEVPAISPDAVPMAGEMPAAPELPGMQPGMQTFDDGSTLQTLDDGSVLALDTAGTPTSYTPVEDLLSAAPQYTPPEMAEPQAGTLSDSALKRAEDLMYDPVNLSPEAYKNLTGSGVDVDLGTVAGELAQPDLSGSLTDLGKAGLEYATTNPFTTAAIIGGGLGLASLGGSQPAAQTTDTPAKKVYTYGAPPPIKRTGLQEQFSAAANIYGPQQARPAVATPPPPPMPQFQSSFQPALMGQAPGAANVGLGAIGQGFAFSPMGAGQTYDISTMSPDQIIRLQEMIGRNQQLGRG